MSEETITMNKLETWVRNRFKGHSLPDHKYPVSYGVYDSDREALHKRNIDNYSKYWEKPAADLQSDTQTLSDQLEKQRKQVYAVAGLSIAQAQKELSKTDYEAFKDEIICWILARPKLQEKGNVPAYGMGIKKLGKEDFTGIDLSPALCELIEKMNNVRFLFVDSCEKLHVINRVIEAKAKNIELSYIPPDLKTEKGKDRKEYAYIETMWESPKTHKGTDGELYVANDWLPDLIQRIDNIEEPTHELILREIQKDFQDFEKVPDIPNLKFIKGLNNINKKSIDEALTFLFNNRHSNHNIKTGAILKRANEYNWWKVKNRK